MKCETCQGKGFIEYESGTIMIECDCGTGVIDDSNSGIGLDDTAAGSTDSGKPQLKRKPKAKKKARARAK